MDSSLYSEASNKVLGLRLAKSVWGGRREKKKTALKEFV